MIGAIVIAILCCVALMLTVLIKPEYTLKKVSVPIYPFVAFVGAVLAISFTPLTLKDCLAGFTSAGAVNPLKILTLFISVTAISVFLDESGFFETLASKVLAKAGGNQRMLFLLLYVSVSVLTVFTSNDIIILTFTPFIIYFCRSAGIKPLPYLIAEFTAANTWSMALIIGNPTNIYLATSAGIGFFEYVKIMILPTILTGVVAGGMLYLIFRKTLMQKFEPKSEKVELKDKPMCILGAVMLAVCTIGLMISGYVGVEMWLECAVCFGVLILCALLVCLIRKRKPVILGHTLARLPYGLIPFVLSMFVISLSLEKTGATAAIASWLGYCELPLYGVTSFLASNFVNNIPMSVIYSSMLSHGSGAAGVFASVMGSNLGALLTPVGALAGIMFSSIARKHGEKFSALTFIKYSAPVSIVSLAVSLLSLALVIYGFHAA